jgi:hypothetical protein
MALLMEDLYKAQMENKPKGPQDDMRQKVGTTSKMPLKAPYGFDCNRKMTYNNFRCSVVSPFQMAV